MDTRRLWTSHRKNIKFIIMAQVTKNRTLSPEVVSHVSSMTYDMNRASESESEIYLEDSENEDYNLEDTVAVTQTGEDLVDVFNNALSEIHAHRSLVQSVTKCVGLKAA